MKAKKVFENIDFKRGQEPKKSLRLGKHRLPQEEWERKTIGNFEIELSPSGSYIVYNFHGGPNLVSKDPDYILDMLKKYPYGKKE